MLTFSKFAQHQPDWVCFDCGNTYGTWHQGKYSGPLTHMSTLHENTCDVCHRVKPVTEARDFGYFIPEWQPYLPFESAAVDGQPCYGCR